MGTLFSLSYKSFFNQIRNYAYNSENSHLSKTSHVPMQKFTPHSRRRDRRRYNVTESSKEVLPYETTVAIQPKSK